MGSGMYTLKEIFQLWQILPLLEKCGLRLNGETDVTLALYDGEKMIATGSIQDCVIQMIAVDPDYQGEGISAQLISELLSRANYEGWLPLYLFTKPEKAESFRSLGFRLVTSAPPYAALLEYGSPDIRSFCRRLQKYRRDGDNAALVMNCNPFTLGHRYLVETAASRAEHVYLFVVQEDRSVFPFRDRLKLVQEGVQDLANVTVIPGGRYIISSLTFPSYFTKEGTQAQAHATLDACIFRDHIAPALGIRQRFVGTEPLSPTTAVYNRALAEILPGAAIALKEIPRRELSGAPISASRVRQLLAQNAMDELRPLVPDSTFTYLCSPEGQAIGEKLREI